MGEPRPGAPLVEARQIERLINWLRNDVSDDKSKVVMAQLVLGGVMRRLRGEKR